MYLKIVHFFVAALIVFSLSVNTAIACSDVMISGNGYTSVARALDFPGGGEPPGGAGVQMGYVPIGTTNTSNINLPQIDEIYPVTWINKYAAIGQIRYINAIHDGINSAGLYVARQNLPAIWTKYPLPDPLDKRPELGTMDVPSYLLGTSATVEEAIANLKEVQMIINAPSTTIFGKTRYLAYPYHLIVRDQNGSSLVVEWINGKTHTYYHQAGAADTVEMVNFKNPQVYSNFPLLAVTNEPPLSWHISNIQQYNQLAPGNNSTPIDGHILMGTGYLGLPGDYSSPSRFARLSTLAKFVPPPNSSLEAETAARSTLTTVVTPVTGGGEYTLWTSVSNLTDRVYYWSPVVSATNTNASELLISPWDLDTPKAIKFELQQIMKSEDFPQGFVDARIQLTTPLSPKEALIAIAESQGGDNQKAGETISIKYSDLTTKFDRNTFNTMPGSGISYL